MLTGSAQATDRHPQTTDHALVTCLVACCITKLIWRRHMTSSAHSGRRYNMASQLDECWGYAQPPEWRSEKAGVT